MSAREAATAPAVTSLWPLRYFVALCMTTSTPSASGCWFTGLANVESRTLSTPCARHTSATRRMSMQRSVGLIGDSNQSSLVRGVMADEGSRVSSSVRKRTVTPNRSSCFRNAMVFP